MDGLDDCCCQPASCQFKSSFGDVLIGAWKLDALAPPAGTQPHCRYFRTLTITVTDSDGGLIALLVLKNKVERGNPVGGIDFGPHTYLESGADAPSPCHFFGNILQGPLTLRSDTGFTLGLSGCGFTGNAAYQMSDEVTLSDVEAAAQLLAQMVDWNVLPFGRHQYVHYLNENVLIDTGAASFGLCGNQRNGFYPVSGMTSWINYYQIPKPPGFPSWLPLTAFGNTGNLPSLVLRATAWTSQMSIPGSWCRYTGLLVPDTSGFPTHCNISANFPSCGVYSGHETVLNGGVVTFNPTGSQQFTVAGCGGSAFPCPP